MCTIAHYSSTIKRDNWFFGNHINSPILRNMFCLKLKYAYQNFYKILWLQHCFSRGLYSYLSSQESVNSEISFIEFLSGMSCQVTTFFDATQCSSEFLCDWIELKIIFRCFLWFSLILPQVFLPIWLNLHDFHEFWEQHRPNVIYRQTLPILKWWILQIWTTFLKSKF